MTIFVSNASVDKVTTGNPSICCKFTTALTLVILVLLTACQSDDRASQQTKAANSSASTIFFAQEQPRESMDGRGFEDALLPNGELTILHGCVGVISRVENFEPEELIIVWPLEYGLDAIGEIPHIADSKTGEILAQVGNYIQIGGGYHRADQARSFAGDSLPESCVESMGDREAFFFAGPSLKVLPIPPAAPSDPESSWGEYTNNVFSIAYPSDWQPADSVDFNPSVSSFVWVFRGESTSAQGQVAAINIGVKSERLADDQSLMDW